MVIGILALVAVPGYRRLCDEAQRTRRQVGAAAIATNQERFHWRTERMGLWPIS